MPDSPMSLSETSLNRSGKPPLPPRHIADLLSELERAVRREERAMTSHDQQEAGAHTETVRLALRAALAEALTR